MAGFSQFLQLCKRMQKVFLRSKIIFRGSPDTGQDHPFRFTGSGNEFAENAFFLTMFKDKENAKTLGDAVQKVMGRRYAIRARCSQTAAQQRPIEEMLKQAKNSGIPTTAV